jgi:hypothetical protein
MNELISRPRPSILPLPVTWLIPVSVKLRIYCRVLSLFILLHHVKLLWVLFPLRLLLEALYL